MFRKLCLLGVAPVVALAAPALPANANAGCGYTAGVVVQSTFYIGCQGFFAGNVINTSSQSAQSSGVTGLGGTYTGSWLVKVEQKTTPLVGGLIDFGQTLYGETIVAAHFGNIWNPDNLVLGGQGNNENVTVFWKFDFGNTGASGIQLLNTRGYSNAALYATSVAVPEPEAWALFTIGFGVLGAAMRGARKRRRGRAVA